MRLHRPSGHFVPWGRSTLVPAPTATAMAIARLTLSIVSIMGFAGLLAGDAGNRSPLLLQAMFVLGTARMLSALIMLVLVRRSPNESQSATMLTVVLDGALAVAIVGAVDTSATPLAWLALLFPVIEAAVLFSLMPAAAVWFGMSLCFLAIRLTAGDSADSNTLSIALQQLVAVFLVSGPAAVISDSSQTRFRRLEEARKDADAIADRLRSVSRATNAMSQTRDPQQMLDIALSSILGLGWMQADVVVRSSAGHWRVAASRALGPRPTPPAEMLSRTVGPGLERLADETLRASGIAEGCGTQIMRADDGSAVVLRAWSAIEQEAEDVKALRVLFDQTRELYRVAMLLRTADRHAQQLEHEVRHDALTRLANRAWVHENLARRLANEEATAVYFIDLDGFKQINDTIGHDAGDQTLISVSNRLRASVPPSAVVGRMGGDEFIVLLPIAGDTEQPTLIQMGERLVASISAPLSLDDGTPVDLGASIGLAVSDGAEDDPDVAINVADTAMYVAKRRGGGLEVGTPTTGAVAA